MRISLTPQPQETWNIDPDAAYLHYTPNETIGGVEFNWVPDLARCNADMPLVADMSSSFMSRPLDVTRFGLIYAGAQKNVGPAGLCIVIVREDLLGTTVPGTPTMFDYKIHADNDSMYNTPPTYPMYITRPGARVAEEKGRIGSNGENQHRQGQSVV